MKTTPARYNSSVPGKSFKKIRPIASQRPQFRSMALLRSLCRTVRALAAEYPPPSRQLPVCIVQDVWHMPSHAKGHSAAHRLHALAFSRHTPTASPVLSSSISGPGATWCHLIGSTSSRAASWTPCSSGSSSMQQAVRRVATRLLGLYAIGQPARRLLISSSCSSATRAAPRQPIESLRQRHCSRSVSARLQDASSSVQSSVRCFSAVPGEGESSAALAPRARDTRRTAPFHSHCGIVKVE